MLQSAVFRFREFWGFADGAEEGLGEHLARGKARRGVRHQHRRLCRNCHRPPGGPVAVDAQWLSWTQATSYCETTAVLFALANDAVPGLPAYTTPAWPLGLNGEPGAVTEDPGVTGFAGPHVLVGAPAWPVVGASTAPEASGVAVGKLAAPTRTSTNLPLSSSWNLSRSLLPPHAT